MELKDVSLDKPIKMVLSALLDQKPIKLEGHVGPVGVQSTGRFIL